MENKPLDERVEALEDNVEKLNSAFPGGDFSGHARYHEMIIEELKSKKDLRKAIIEKVVTGSVWALAFGLFTAVVSYLKDHVFTVFK
jgi:hypothetical protein